MSEDITIGSGTETILGTFAGAQAYVGLKLGDRYDNWADDTEVRQQKSLINAVHFLNVQAWGEDADTFEKRDAIEAFHHAQYELGVLIHEDSEITDEADQGSNIQSLEAGTAGLKFFNPTTRGAAKLPPVLMRLVGSYLAASTSGGPAAASGQSGSCHNPFSNCSDNDRGEPW